VRRVVLAVVASGCIDATPLPLPPEAAEAKSVFVAVDSGEDAVVFAADLPALPPITAADEALYLFLHGTDLASLGVSPGLVMKLAESEDGRPLPMGSIFSARLPDAEWTEILREELPPSIRDFRLPDLALGACEESGGCFRIQHEEEYCQLPCVEPVEADPLPPRMAALPLPPELTPCRDGWAEIAPDASRPEAICAPLALTCAGVHYLGDAACSIPGGECPAGDFSETLPPGPRWYVREGASGSGTMADPFGSIQAALGAAAAGDVVVVGKGTYAGPITIDEDVAVVGACAQTRVVSTIDVLAAASLSSLEVTAGTIGIRIAAGATATLRDVVVSGGNTGIQAAGSLRGGRVVLEAGSGIDVSGDAELDRAIVRGATGIGVFATGTARFTNLRVSGSSDAVLAGAAGELTIEGLHLDSNRTGVTAVNDATIEIDGALIERSTGEALIAREASSLTARKIHGRQNLYNALSAGGSVLVENGLFETPAMHNAVIMDGTMTLRRSVLAGAPRFGIWATGGALALESVRIRDHASLEDGEGIVVHGPVVLEAKRLAIERARDYGVRVLASEGKAELRLEDLILRDIAGYGIEMGHLGAPETQSTLAIDRLFAEEVSSFAVRLVSGEANRIDDAILRGLPAGGISTVGGVLTINRAELSGIVGPSLSVTSGEMVLNDLRVLEPENGLVTEGWISTEVSAIDAAMNVNRFEISGATGAGVLIRQFSRMRFGAGRIFDNQVGVEVRADGFVYPNLEGDVIYRGNVEHNLLKLGQMQE
jgi:hypothetical protein